MSEEISKDLTKRCVGRATWMKGKSDLKEMPRDVKMEGRMQRMLAVLIRVVDGGWCSACLVQG